ncbi:hypothetical protein HK097_001769 [Rhizophlyctis rosea]|uniref:Cyanovirin-N domain-containing protein n=1 Tax=Rhizophlyctis rosea TaxID=64517 RepID=A0AAD5S686_9FUNG|nr:hypothetical protein HK097_001769 [Rhizophlyctis rosea]
MSLFEQVAEYLVGAAVLPPYAQRYPQTVKNIRLVPSPTNVILHADCLKKDGTYRTSSIDLNPCIGKPESGRLNPKRGYTTHLLSDPKYFRNLRLEDGGKTLKAEVVGYGDHTFNLGLHLFNHNGWLEFWVKEEDDILPDWVVNLAEAVGGDFEEYLEGPDAGETMFELAKEILGIETALDKWEDEWERKNDGWWEDVRLEGKDKKILVRRGK